MGKTAYLSHALMNHYLGTSAYTMPTTYLALINTAGAEPVGNGYARIAGGTKFGAPASKIVLNDEVVTFPPSTGAGWGDIFGFALFDALTAGNKLIDGWLVNAWKDFVAAATGDVITSIAHGYADTTKVVVTGILLPTGLAEGTVYFVRDATTDTFKLALTSGGAAIDMTAVGGGRIGAVTVQPIAGNTTPSFAVGALSFADY